ncbi:replication protein [Providencia rettgeri]|nr:replication protein [Providencia rettgeri]
MANTAEDNVIQLRPQIVNLEGRVASIEDGYARLSNILLEEYSGADLTKRQFKVLLAILRLTYGWNKKIDRISNSQIAAIAKLPEKRCSETKLQLVKMNVLIQKGNQFGPNKNISEWCIPQNEGDYPKAGDFGSLNLGDVAPSKQGDTKDIIPKTIKNNKNTMSEEVRSTDEKSKSEPTKQDPFIEPFEKIFWIAGMRKVGKDKSKAAFKSKFKEWRKETGGSIDEFAKFLADDIQCRLRIQQFGFDKMHPATYLNGSRWTDEKPELPQDTAQQPSITVSKNGLVFY